MWEGKKKTGDEKVLFKNFLNKKIPLKETLLANLLKSVGSKPLENCYPDGGFLRHLKYQALYLKFAKMPKLENVWY